MGGSKEATLLQENYRKENTAEFEYFITSLLPKIGHNRIRFDLKKRKKVISEIFTIQDEAFGLLILCNEYDVWVWQRKAREEGKKGNQLRMKKKFVDMNSGNQNSWSEHGISLFYDLCREIKERRETVESKKMEEDLMDKIINNHSKKSVGNIEEPTWCDLRFQDGMAEKFKVDWSCV